MSSCTMASQISTKTIGGMWSPEMTASLMETSAHLRYCLSVCLSVCLSIVLSIVVLSICHLFYQLLCCSIYCSFVCSFNRSVCQNTNNVLVTLYSSDLYLFSITLSIPSVQCPFQDSNTSSSSRHLFDYLLYIPTLTQNSYLSSNLKNRVSINPSVTLKMTVSKLSIYWLIDCLIDSCSVNGEANRH